MDGLILVPLFPQGHYSVEFVFSFSQEPNVSLNDETCSWREGQEKDEITSSHYLVFGGEIHDSNAIKQLTPGLSMNSSQLICIGGKSNQNTPAQQV